MHRTCASRVVYANPPDHPGRCSLGEIASRPGDLFIDVGSNVEIYAIWAAELGAEVIALEPAEDTFALLEENVALNGYPIKTIRVGGRGHAGVARFTSGRDCVNRLECAGGVEVTMLAIDSIIGNRTVASMKVDVEGFRNRRAARVRAGPVRAPGQAHPARMERDVDAGGRQRTGRPVASLLAAHGYHLYCARP